MPRVHEVAKELGLTSREVIAELNALGHPVTSHASSVDDDTVASLKEHLGDGAASPGRSDPAPVPEAPAEPEPQPEPEAAKPSLAEVRGEPEPPRRRPWIVRQLIELPLLILLAFGIAIVIKTFIAQAFYIPSPSMRPTLNEGDRVLVEKLSYRFRDPARGDVVVFAKEVFGAPQDLPWQEDARNFLRELLGLPTGREEDYIKRVVAVGGDVVRYAGTPRRLTVNGREVDEPYVFGGRDRASQALRARDCARLDMAPGDGGCIVPAGKVFVMGDNRGDSEDSRVIGPVSEDKIVGRAFVVIWPPGDWRGL
jgi:signal peptidase I